MRRIFCEIEKCLACQSCELACAAAHASSKDLMAAIQAEENLQPRIHVEAVDMNEPLQRVRAIAVQCRHCGEPACVSACIAGAISKNEETGVIILRVEKCVGCWSCIMVCPTGAIRRNENRHQALKCDRCPDLDVPACVRACPTRALLLNEDAPMEIR